jgi:cytochrome c-type biogenesis protein CcmH/NrfG
MKRSLLIIIIFGGFLLQPASAQKKRTPPPTRRTTVAPAANKAPARVAAAARSIRVLTRAGATVWLDEVRRGVTGADGVLEIKNVMSGRHTLRVRAKGFQERTLALAPTQRGQIDVPLKPTTDEAELAFQEAEEASGRATDEAAREQAVELYRRALSLRPRFPEAHVALARLLLAMGRTDDALDEIEAARRDRPVYPEASAVEGRILRATADEDAAVESYRRAIREGRGFQPEAYAGLGIALEERGDYEGAIEAFRKAIAQLSDTEPALYQLLGAAYEKLERWKEALAAYEKYLALAPEGRFASAIRSIIDQLRVQAAEQESAPPIP